MAVRFAYSEEPDWLVDWILSDLAVRVRSRGRTPMVGMWINRQFANVPKGGPSRPRGSDLSERRYVALSVLLATGRSMSEALYEVGRRLDKTTLKELEVIRTNFYQFQHPLKDTLLENWLSSFRSWTDWAISARQESISFVAEQYRNKGQEDKAGRVLHLVQAIQEKAAKQHKLPLYRDRDWYIAAEHEYCRRFAATEAALGPNQWMVGWSALILARLYHDQAKYAEAQRWYWRAWDICLGDPALASRFRMILLWAIAIDLGNCARGKPRAATASPHSGPWTLFGLLLGPGVSKDRG